MSLDLSNISWIRLLIYLVISTFFLGNLSTYLKRKILWHDGYSRKLNHFGHMVISTPLLAFLPVNILIPTVFVGSILVILIYGLSSISKKRYIYGIVEGSLRERDNPRKRFFFFFPLITGNIALIFCVLNYPLDYVRIAFFTVAFADGFAEPVGLKFGVNNKYKVKDYIWGGENKKSAAGSFIVFLFSFLICFLFFLYLKEFSISILMLSLIYGVLIFIVEAISPRGMDNMNIFLFSPLFLIFLDNFFV